MKRCIWILAAMICVLSGCSDSPEDLVKQDFEKRKFFSGADLKAKIAEDVESERKAVYEYFLESDGEDVAREEADLAADAIAQQYVGWTDDDFEKRAASNRKWLAGSVLTVKDVKINGTEAVVTANVALRGGLVQVLTYNLVKGKDGWIIRPQKETASEENENSEDTGYAEEE